MKIVLGAYDLNPHPMHYEWIDTTWVLSDINPRYPGIIKADARYLEWLNEPIEAIYASHVVEHIEPEEVGPMFCRWFELLPVGGYAVINVPDIEWLCQEIIKVEKGGHPTSDYFNTTKKLMEVIYGNVGDTVHDKHRWGYTKNSLKEALEEAGFSVQSQRRYDAHDMGVVIATATKL